MSLSRKALRISLKWRKHIHRRAGVALRKTAAVVGRAKHLQYPEIGRRRNDADNRAGTIVEAQRASDDARIPLELPLPEILANKDDAAAAGSVLLGGERAPDHRLDAEHREESLAHAQRGHPRRLPVVRHQIHLARTERGEISDAAAPLLEIKKVGKRCRLVCRAARPIGLPDHHEPIDVGHGHRPQENRIDDADDCCRHADAQSEGEDRDGRKSAFFSNARNPSRMS